MRKTIVILSALMLLAVPAFGQWHSDTRISNTSGSSYTNSGGGWGISSDTDNVYMVWYDYTYYSTRIRYEDFPIGSPPAPGTGTGISSYYGYHAVVSSNGDGIVYTAWRDGSYRYRLRFRENDGGWGSIQTFGVSGYSNYYPAITTDPSGITHTAYHRYRGSYPYYYYIYYQQYNGSSFGSPVLVKTPPYTYRDAEHPSICRESNGYLHMAWTQDWSPYRIGYGYSTNNGSSWNVSDIPNTQGYYSSNGGPSMCVDHNDDLYVAYVSRASSPYDIYVAINDGSWNTPVNVSNSPSSCYSASICCDTSGNIWVFWHDYRGTRYEIWYNRYDVESGSWLGEMALTADDGQYSYRPQVSADPHGNIHVMWYDRRDGNYEIYYNWYSVSGGGGGRDLACTRILKPVGLISGEPIVPEAVIANLGGSVDSGYAICEITGPGANYDKGNAEGPIHLEPGQEDNVTFPPWTPPGGPGDQYRISVTVFLWPEETTEDDDPSNNTQVEYATIVGGVQVDPVQIAAPEDGETYDHLAPAATFENTGTEVATDFYCYCEINQMAFMAEPYIDSFPVASLDVEATVDVPFADWYGDDELMYDAMFYAAIPGEPDRELIGITEIVSFQGAEWTGIDELPTGAVIALAGENPLRDEALINYALPSPTDVNVSVYDVSGALVSTLHDGQLSGEGSLRWEASAVSTGIYFVRIATPDFSHTIKLIMVH